MDPNPSRDIYIMAPESVAQGTSRKRKQKECTNQRVRKIVSPRNICLNKTQRMEMSTDILMWKRENLMGSHSWKKNYRQPMTAEGERISFFQG